MPVLAELVDGVIGVDSHRDTLAAAALSSVGGVWPRPPSSADAAGYQALLGFADAGPPRARARGISNAA